MGIRNRQCSFLYPFFLLFSILQELHTFKGQHKNYTWIRTIRLCSICAHDLRMRHMEGTCNTHKVQHWTVGKSVLKQSSINYWLYVS